MLYLRPKLRLDIVVADEDVERAIQVILTHARSGEIGDGKIFVLPVVDAVRIRTGERGEGVVAAHDEAVSHGLSGAAPGGIAVPGEDARDGSARGAHARERLAQLAGTIMF